MGDAQAVAAQLPDIGVEGCADVLEGDIDMGYEADSGKTGGAANQG